MMAKNSAFTPLIEKMLYEWARDQGYTEKKDILITKTAYQKKGGRWTNPDFVAAGFRSLPYIHGNQIDLFSFEIKRGWADATSVYEAVAHQRFVNYAYLLVAEPNETCRLSHPPGHCIWARHWPNHCKGYQVL